MADFTTSEVAEILLALRMKIVKIVVVMAIIWAITFAFFSDTVITRLVEDLLPRGAEVIYTRPLEGMILKLKISLIFGVVAVLPYIVILMYKALKERTEILSNVEFSRGTVFRYSVVSVILFAAGVIYGYNILQFFLTYLYEMGAAQGVLAYYSIAEFINFAVLMLVIFGVIFQMPLIMTFLVGYNIVQFQSLTYYRRHLYISFFLLGAVITPPDIFTQTIISIPMIIFFEISIIVIRIIHRDKIKQQQQLEEQL
ncbi:MAG: twin-arginine translocase subunit TatC [Halobacteriota archaeon]